MRLATPNPCMGSTDRLFRISMSSVPCTTSVDSAMVDLLGPKRYHCLLLDVKRERSQGHQDAETNGERPAEREDQASCGCRPAPIEKLAVAPRNDRRVHDDGQRLKQQSSTLVAFEDY